MPIALLAFFYSSLEGVDAVMLDTYFIHDSLWLLRWTLLASALARLNLTRLSVEGYLRNMFQAFCLAFFAAWHSQGPQTSYFSLLFLYF